MGRSPPCQCPAAPVNPPMPQSPRPSSNKRGIFPRSSWALLETCVPGPERHRGLPGCLQDWPAKLRRNIKRMSQEHWRKSLRKGVCILVLPSTIGAARPCARSDRHAHHACAMLPTPTDGPKSMALQPLHRSRGHASSTSSPADLGEAPAESLGPVGDGKTGQPVHQRAVVQMPEGRPGPLGPAGAAYPGTLSAHSAGPAGPGIVESRWPAVSRQLAGQVRQ